MNYRIFKDKKISQLGFGAMRLPLSGSDAANIDKKTTEEIMMYAYENGVNYYDTAYVYHKGFSERVLGEILRSNHILDKVNVADKLPLFDIDEKFDPYALLDEQLTRLGTEKIDFYLMHNMTKAKWDKLKKMDIFRFMEDAKKSGKIGALGFSFHDTYDAYKYVIDEYDWQFSQIQLNFMDIEYQAGLKGLSYAASKNIPVIIMEPLKGGQLLMIKDSKVNELKKKYHLENASTAEISLNFLFDRPEILCVLSGMNALNQVKENIQTASKINAGMQPQNEKDFLTELRSYILSKDGIPCTACQYCVEGCPQNIEIPGVLELYNNAVMFDSKIQNKSILERFYSNAKDCIECGQCENVCPQSLKIPELLKKTVEYLNN